MAHYKKATKNEKGKILDYLQKLTGFNRSYLARRLRTFSFQRVISNLEKHGYWKYGEEVKAHLLEMSSSTMDRRLRKYKLSLKRRRKATTKPGTLLKNSDTGSFVS